MIVDPSLQEDSASEDTSSSSSEPEGNELDYIMEPIMHPSLQKDLPWRTHPPQVQSVREVSLAIMEPVQAKTTLRHRVVYSHEQARVQVGDDGEKSEALLEEDQSHRASMVLGSSLLEDWQNYSRKVTTLREKLRHAEGAHQLLKSELSTQKQLSEKLARYLEVKDQNITTLQANISILEENLEGHEVKLRSEMAEREKYMDQHNIECLKMVIAGHKLQVQQLLEEKARVSQTLTELEQKIQDLEAHLNETSLLLAKEKRLSLSAFEMYKKKRFHVMLHIVLGMFLITLVVIGILYILNF